MVRQTEAGAFPRVGTGSAVRPDPFALPLRLAAPDAAADGGERRVTLDGDRVLVDRMVRSVSMRIAVPLSTFSGVALRAAPGLEPDADRIEVVLAHRDRGFDVPLYDCAPDGDGLAAWRGWSRALNLPLLIEDLDGRRVTTTERLGAVEVGRPRPRRRHSLLAGRRPRFLTRRRPAKLAPDAKVARGEREIIARN